MGQGCSPPSPHPFIGEMGGAMFIKESLQVTNGTLNIYKPHVGKANHTPPLSLCGKTSPPRVKFFAWLLTQQWIQCKTNLVRKRILDDAICDLCGVADEDSDHIVSQCAFIRSSRVKIGWQPDNITVGNYEARRSPPWSYYLLLCCWEIWKHKHDVIFRRFPPSIDRLVAAYMESAKLWQCRLPRSKALLVTY